VISRRFVIPALACAIGATATAHEDRGVIWVANNGTDTPSCGSSELKACRSIGFGVANANEGDLVLVGPGLYGDIDNDLQFTTSGDETPDFGLGCAVCIDKAVAIASTDGAKVTVIELGRPSAGEVPPDLRHTVLIRASGVRFGAPGHGFTLYASTDTGIRVAGGGNVRVVGNIVLRSKSAELGFSTGTGMAVVGPAGPVRVAQNAVHGHSSGFIVISDEPVTLVDNVALSNQGASGFSIQGAGRHVIAGNTSTANGIGFGFGVGTYIVKNNVASNNQSSGFVFGHSDHTIQRNTSVGNDTGFFVAPTFSGPVGQPRFHFNNMIGNRRCGLFNNSGRTIDATNNYWGSPNGPGPKPADAAPNVPACRGTEGTNTATVVPFSRKRF
jgi:hypothetical protein